MVNERTHTEQREPVHNSLPACWDLVIEEMKDRDQIGRQRYGTPLQPFNGRNALRDVSEELLDAVVYNRQLRYELSCLRADLVRLNAEVTATGREILRGVFERYPFLEAETKIPEF